jgi:Zn-finger nucleic acid-binding protein
MNCPQCETDLKIAERSGIGIDYCPNCRGVWLDRREQDKIIERFAMDQPVRGYEEYPRRPYEPPRGGGYYPKKKEKSLLDELFDF